MARGLILIVDDNEMNQQLVTYLLARGGFDVRAAYDAPQALHLLQTLRPDLILMDLQLPGMNGLDLTRRIKADPALRGTVVVAITAYAMRGDEQRARDAGCDGYVTKPIDTASFVETVSAYLGVRSQGVNAAQLH